MYVKETPANTNTGDQEKQGEGRIEKPENPPTQYLRMEEKIFDSKQRSRRQEDRRGDPAGNQTEER